MKHLVDIDDELLERAKGCLGTETIKATVDEALRQVTNERARRQQEAIEGLKELLALHPGFDRSEAW